jgi:hypothetical protein
MTIPAAGNDIQKSDIINEFTTDVINVANAAVVYNLSNNPFTNAGYAAYANPYLDNAVATAPTAGELSGDIDAQGAVTAIADLLRTYAYNASRIRDVYYQYDAGVMVFWGQGVTIMNSGYVQASLLSSGTPPATGADIVGGAGGALDIFINTLASDLATARTNTVVLTACHSSCHVSCHGARGRR